MVVLEVDVVGLEVVVVVVVVVVAVLGEVEGTVSTESVGGVEADIVESEGWAGMELMRHKL